MGQLRVPYRVVKLGLIIDVDWILILTTYAS